MIVKCKNCLCEFKKKPSRITESNFCSRNCKHSYGRLVLTCLNCKKTFIKIAFRSDAIFCERNCKTQYSINKHSCEKCGKEFTRGKSYEGSAKFCSMECRKIEDCHGVSTCEKCNIEFEWNRGKDSIKPRFCSLECRGHTGFRPGCSFRISELTDQQKLENIKKSFERDVIRKEGCWDWKGKIATSGYAAMTLNVQYRCGTSHRASWLIHKGPIPKGMHVCHTCDNRKCTNPDHLWLGTAKQNNDDKIAKGRTNNVPPPIKRGSQNGMAILHEDQVKEIKKLIAEGIVGAEIGRKFGVSKK